MKILLFEDNQGNMDVAQRVMSKHSVHDFTFCSKGNDALEAFVRSDGLISDFFCPAEDGEIERLYQELYFNPLLDALGGITGFSTPKTEQGKEIKEFINSLLSKRLIWGSSDGVQRFCMHIKEFFTEYGNGPPRNDYLHQNRGYGGVLMLQAYEQNKPCVLFSDLHSHGLEYSKGNPINGMVMLAPLMAKGIFTPEQLKEYHGEQGSRLIGSSGYCKVGKESPEQWELAYQKLISQVS